MKKIYFLLLLSFLLVLACDDGTTTVDSDKITVRVIPDYLEKIDGAYPAVLDYPVKAIVQVTPPVNGKSVFISDDNGFFTIDNVPDGSYTVHPLFTDSASDKTVVVSTGAEPEYHEIVFPANGVGLYYYLFNLTESGFPAFTTDFRLGMAKMLNRQSLLDAVEMVNAPAQNLVPPEYQYDGLENIQSISEDPDWLDNHVTADQPVDFEIYYNEHEGAHLNIATQFRNQIEAADSVGSITLIAATDWDDFLAQRNAFNFDLVRAGWLMDSNNMLMYFQVLVDQAGYENAEFDRLVADAEAALGNGDLSAYVAKNVAIHNLLLNDALIIPVYYY
ncbi:MAG: hypothetical protein JXR86_10430 [Spirochaetales bacterium]|nr:hypothetical protein [Spirochaetales bacterium]